jgi:uncharacterized protein YdeI (YjbR/CyaY-like superfamily)
MTESQDRLQREKAHMVTKKGIAVPPELADALQAQPQLLAVFERMRPSCQREYADWISEGRKSETRAARVDKTLAQIAQWGERHGYQ